VNKRAGEGIIDPDAVHAGEVPARDVRGHGQEMLMCVDQPGSRQQAAAIDVATYERFLRTVLTPHPGVR
jgi:hypothetical protein